MINTYVVPCRYGERGGAQRGRGGGGGGWSQGGGGGSGQWQDRSTFYEDDYSQDYSSDRYQVCTLLFFVRACIALFSCLPYCIVRNFQGPIFSLVSLMEGKILNPYGAQYEY